MGRCPCVVVLADLTMESWGKTLFCVIALCAVIAVAGCDRVAIKGRCTKSYYEPASRWHAFGNGLIARDVREICDDWSSAVEGEAK